MNHCVRFCECDEAENWASSGRSLQPAAERHPPRGEGLRGGHAFPTVWPQLIPAGRAGGPAPFSFSPHFSGFGAMVGAHGGAVSLFLSLRSAPVSANIHRHRSCRAPSASSARKEASRRDAARSRRRRGANFKHRSCGGKSQGRMQMGLPQQLGKSAAKKGMERSPGAPRAS